MNLFLYIYTSLQPTTYLKTKFEYVSANIITYEGGTL